MRDDFSMTAYAGRKFTEQKPTAGNLKTPWAVHSLGKVLDSCYRCDLEVMAEIGRSCFAEVGNAAIESCGGVENPDDESVRRMHHTEQRRLPPQKTYYFDMREVIEDQRPKHKKKDKRVPVEEGASRSPRSKSLSPSRCPPPEVVINRSVSDLSDHSLPAGVPREIIGDELDDVSGEITFDATVKLEQFYKLAQDREKRERLKAQLETVENFTDLTQFKLVGPSPSWISKASSVCSASVAAGKSVSGGSRVSKISNKLKSIASSVKDTKILKRVASSGSLGSQSLKRSLSKLRNKMRHKEEAAIGREPNMARPAYNATTSMKDDKWERIVV